MVPGQGNVRGGLKHPIRMNPKVSLLRWPCGVWHCCAVNRIPSAAVLSSCSELSFSIFQNFKIPSSIDGFALR